MAAPTIGELQKKFAFLEGEVLAILLFGSYAKDEMTPRSDIDLCIVAPDKSPAEMMRKVWQRMNTAGWDIYCFQEFPLHLKMEIIQHHKVLFAADLPALHEYFYFFRKLWNDQKHRQEVTKEEVLAMLG